MELPRHGRAPAPGSLLVIAAVTSGLAATSVVALDRSVARWLSGYEPHALWDRGLELLEWTLLLPAFRFAVAGILVIGMIATVAIPRWRVHAPAWMYFAGVHVVSRFAMIHIKTVTGRLRPAEWLAQGGDTFWQRGGISFPSGHVVLFASVIIPAVVLWPRSRPLLAIIGFVMLARLAVNAHFVSDVVAALTLVTLISWATGWLIQPRRP